MTRDFSTDQYDSDPDAPTPVCGATFGSKSCCMPLGHDPPWHTSPSGSAWPVEVHLGLDGRGEVQLLPLRDGIVERLVKAIAFEGCQSPDSQMSWLGSQRATDLRSALHSVLGTALRQAALWGMSLGYARSEFSRGPRPPEPPPPPPPPPGPSARRSAPRVLALGSAPVPNPTLASEVTRWSRCEISRCVEVRDHYDGEPVPRPPKMPCGCGEHDVRVDGLTIHWLGAHWDADCAFQKSTKLLAKALDAKEDET